MIWVRRTADDVPEKISRSSIKGSSKQPSSTKQAQSNSFSNPAFTAFPEENNPYEIPQNSTSPGYVTVQETTYEKPSPKVAKLSKTKSKSRNKADPELAAAVYNM